MCFAAAVSSVSRVPGLCFAAGDGVKDAQQNRDYVVQKVSNEIHEMIRVLQLTTYDEDEWDADDITVMKKAQVRSQADDITVMKNAQVRNQADDITVMKKAQVRSCPMCEQSSCA